ncbi:hypothetical protein X802_05055 [Thermococcus guaymasensis DSM 11113]|uniref:Uncharacterized protein n=1 Tax=Thermococcus guaymasensis DSM 11113 TaxID=1432656 RepID=A0A0X1KK10_9EURY|nr:hypothetical protein X802_05055 [Thermococcus guaymasensis DSM 11113]
MDFLRKAFRMWRSHPPFVKKFGGRMKREVWEFKVERKK